MTDLIIIGAGTAGLTSAIYALRAGMTVNILEQTIYGGQIITSASIENYPGMPGVSGADFAVALYKQAQDLGANIMYETVNSVKLDCDPKEVVTSKNVFQSKSVIIAAGSKPRKLECKGEESFIGKGISFCATCDGAFHRGKDVAVIGGGNLALDDAMTLSDICKNVFLIHRRDEFRGASRTLDLLKNKDNVKFITSSVVDSFNGTDKLSSLTIKNLKDNSVSDLEISGAFVAIGSIPNTASFKDQIDMDEFGYVKAGEDCLTNLHGVFVAGDIRAKPVRQIVTAAADGATAALAAKDYVQKN